MERHGRRASARGASPRRVRELLEWAEAYLERYGIYKPRLNAELLLSHCAGCGRAELYARPEMEMSAAARRAFFRCVRRRAGREPLQYVTGVSGFRRLELAVDGRVLIPRPETEMLVERALEILRGEGGHPLVVDVGTGSGCIALSLAKEHPQAVVHATDGSGEALQAARENASRLGMEGVVDFHRGDLLRALPPRLEGRIDLVVSNPPYVREADFPLLPPEVREHEPRVALVAGPGGTEVHARLAEQALSWLAPGGCLLMECGEDQAEELCRMLENLGYAAVRKGDDLTGRPRMVEGRRAPRAAPG
ncbi:MAG: peptide chain release factor N(5)-glutamine methyltransferase [Actinobacteria bacterium]|nr:peptide chain release factor N(5)-glutamine methyltransferase [Actinomycetota bacterium]